MEALLKEQQMAIQGIGRVMANYKKLGKARFSLASAEDRLRRLHQEWANVKRLHLQLELKATDQDRLERPYFAKGEFFIAEELYEEACDYFGELVASFKASPSGTDSGTGNAPSITKLPRIPLPTFAGSYLDWPSFRDLFESLVISDKSLADVQRLHYLRGSLCGPALQLVAPVPVLEANFAVAWNSLKDRYDNMRAVVASLVNRIVSSPSVSGSTDSGLAQFRSNLNEALALLKNIGRPTDQWDDLLVHILVRKFDKRLLEEWEDSLGARTDPPTYADLDKFLAARIRCKEAVRIVTETPSVGQPRASSGSASTNVRAHAVVTAPNRCLRCRAKHALYRCAEFLRLSTANRKAFVRKSGCCFNCLGQGHSASHCPSDRSCTHCGQRHHSSLHLNDSEQGRGEGVRASTDTAAEQGDGNPSCASSHLCESRISGTGRPNVLLATAKIKVFSQSGAVVVIRALLDQGAEASFVSESLVQTLRLPRSRASVTITGAGGVRVGMARSRVSLSLASTAAEGDQLTISALVLPQLSAYACRVPYDLSCWPALQGLSLADPSPNSPEPIELLIGADYYGSLLREGLRRGGPGGPIAQHTRLGWVVSGPVPAQRSGSGAVAAVRALHCVSNEQLGQQLQCFWEIEEIRAPPGLTPDEAKCEEYFKSTVSRRADGRYVVRLPLKGERPLAIGRSRTQAERVLASVERRLRADQQLETDYREFMSCYEEMGHMEEIPRAELADENTQRVFLPHHPVVKVSEGGVSRLRVVFNASSRTSNGSTLNEHLLPGPKLQADIVAIVARWRMFRVAVKADIEKMFRQIRVDLPDADLQCILWSRGEGGLPNAYRLTTVTYGTASAPYLAQRVLRQLAADEGDRYPLGKKILLRHFYVDDVLFGASDVEAAAARCRELQSLLARGGFPLKKWAASDPAALAETGSEERVELGSGSDSDQQVLGLVWRVSDDAFGFSVRPAPSTFASKRVILSTIARLYDPLGWVSPAVVTAKIFIQDLWLRGVDWDAPVPEEIANRWKTFQHELPGLRDVRLPRWHGVDDDSTCELHGFADASARAYAAVVFAVVSRRDRPGRRVTLVAARTRVAPVRTVSIPRLELCASVLLARLLHTIRTECAWPSLQTYAWTDSKVVLDWLARPASSWQVFVANRVSEVHSTLPGVPWCHVPSADNPADCASRGMFPAELLSHSLWWNGPAWLQGHQSEWPRGLPDSQSLLAREELRVHLSAVGPTAGPVFLPPLPDSVSSWAKLIRVTAACFKFADTARASRAASADGRGDGGERSRRARYVWLRWLQHTHFPTELRALGKGKPISRSSPLIRLTPFLDEEGLLRVGGRLARAPLPYDEKHPVVVPRHRVTRLLVEHTHLVALHGGPQLTLSVLRRSYWLLGGRSVVKDVIRQCVVCARHRAAPIHPRMADLPAARVTPSRPFTHVGVDYAGPIATRTGKGRGHKSFKSYIAIFVCFSTRAVHLELVSDCAASGFLAALHRFVSRRGAPSVVYSDNGRNFTGAARELREVCFGVVRDPSVTAFLEGREIQWHFIPPGAPHFGGLWEAGVKSAKQHLRRVIGETTLTFEEMATFLCMTEACLNSRPIAPMSSEPSDVAALTPGHFLIGAAPLSLPSRDDIDASGHVLSRWQLVVRMREHFWRAWQREYLHSLQSRSKWWKDERNLKVGDLVVVRNPNSPPACWKLGRISATRPGPDGRVRVVDVRTTTGTLERPVTQLVRLPLQAAESSADQPT